MRNSFYNDDTTKWIINKPDESELWETAGTDTQLGQSKNVFHSTNEWRLDRARSWRNSSNYVETNVITWDSQGRVTASENANKWNSYVDYDPDHGYVTSTRNEYYTNGSTEYDGLARPEEVTDANGNTAHLRYDEYSRLTDVWLAPHTPSNQRSRPSLRVWQLPTTTCVMSRPRRCSTTQASGCISRARRTWMGLAARLQTDATSPNNPTGKRTVTNMKYDGAGRVHYSTPPVQVNAVSTPEFVDWNWAWLAQYTVTHYDAAGPHDFG